MRRGDLAVGGLSLGLGVATLALVPWGVSGASLAAVLDMRSPAFFPILTASLLGVFGAVLVVRAWRAPGEVAPGPVAAPGRVLAVAGVLIIYGIAVPWLGMFVSSGIVIVLLAWILGERRGLRVAGLAVAVPLLVYFLFERYLLILFPRGIWF